MEKLSGDQESTSELLEYVRQVVSQFALERILKSPGLGEVDAGTRCCLLWRWTYNNAKAPFDDARKLALASGTDVTGLWDRAGFVKKEKEFVSVLNSQDRARDEAFIRKEKVATVVAALNRALFYCEKGQKGKLAEFLDESGYGRKERVLARCPSEFAALNVLRISATIFSIWLLGGVKTGGRLG